MDQIKSTWWSITCTDIGNVKGSWNEIAKENNTSAQQIEEEPWNLVYRGWIMLVKDKDELWTLCWWGSMWCCHRSWKFHCRLPGIGWKMVGKEQRRVCIVPPPGRLRRCRWRLLQQCRWQIQGQHWDRSQLQPPHRISSRRSPEGWSLNW